MHSRMLGCNCWAYTNAKVLRENRVRQDAAAKIHNGCGREWDCYSQIKHQIVETLLWYAVMESYWRGDCNNNTNRREKERKQKKKQSQTWQTWGVLNMHNIVVLLLRVPTQNAIEWYIMYHHLMGWVMTRHLIRRVHYDSSSAYSPCNEMKHLRTNKAQMSPITKNPIMQCIAKAACKVLISKRNSILKY